MTLRDAYRQKEREALAKLGAMSQEQYEAFIGRLVLMTPEELEQKQREADAWLRGLEDGLSCQT